MRYLIILFLVFLSACKSESTNGIVLETKLVPALGGGYYQDVEYQFRYKGEIYYGMQKRRSRFQGEYLMKGDSVSVLINPFLPKSSKLGSLVWREKNDSDKTEYHYKLDSKNNSITVFKGDSVIKVDSFQNH